MKCPACGWIVRKDHGEPAAHPCNPPKLRRTRARRQADSLYEWARAYNDSEGHERIGGPEDR